MRILSNLDKIRQLFPEASDAALVTLCPYGLQNDIPCNPNKVRSNDVCRKCKQEFWNSKYEQDNRLKVRRKIITNGAVRPSISVHCPMCHAQLYTEDEFGNKDGIFTEYCPNCGTHMKI